MRAGFLGAVAQDAQSGVYDDLNNKYAGALTISRSAKNQGYYDNKWNSLTDMYGVKGNTGFNPEAWKKHYRNFCAGGVTWQYIGDMAIKGGI